MRKLASAGAGALVSGALLTASMPPADLGMLSWLCMAPLLIGVRGSGFVVGSLAALGAALIAAWLSVIGVFYPGVARLDETAAWHYVGFFLFSLSMVAVAGIWADLKTTSRWVWLWLPAIAVVAEATLLLYLPAHLGLAHYRSPFLLKLASFTGIWGVSYLVWASNVRVAMAFADGRLRERSKLLAARTLDLSLLAVILAAMVWRFPPPAPGALGEGKHGQMLLAAIQTLSHEPDQLDRLHRQAAAHEPEFVVWPELSASGWVVGGDVGELQKVSEQGVAFVTSYPRLEGGSLPYNVSTLFVEGKALGNYRKRKLFGGERSMHLPGSKPTSARFRKGDVGLLVCFDSCFPYIVRETASLPGVNSISLPSMGPESPFGVMQAVHGAFTPFRAAENGVAIARGESSAFAQIVDGDGRIVAEAPAGFEGAIAGWVSDRPRWTFYKVAGDWFLGVCVVVTLIVGATAILRQRNEAVPGRSDT
ncbi:MAG: hypothetical protein DCC46_12845 [Armatimonadetes bacterium]|nr:MAG: hypothetical protein DCC46_12845 [Armatimonadota bacterium]